MSDNLLKIGTSAVLANSRLLSTTSNNIANLNSTGYVRQRTEFEAQILGMGVGKGTTERLVSDFTLKQLRRDTSNYSYSQQYLAEANRVDALFSNAANSISTSVNELFKQMQVANNDPSTLANRGLIIGSSQALLDKFNTMSVQVLGQEQFVNQQMEIYVKETNSYIEQIALLNKEIAAYGTGASKPVPLDLLDKRDQAILNLSSMMEINVLDAKNGEKQVFTSTGRPLVLEQSHYNMLSLRSDPDTSRLELSLSWNENGNVKHDLNVKETGGKLGALVAFREEILDPTQNQLGQLALSLADAMNTQNRLGMNWDGEIGKDLFKLPVFSGLSHPENTGTGSVAMQIEAGQGKNLPPNDFRITYESATQVRVQVLDTRGEPIAGTDKLVTIPPMTIDSGSTGADGDLYGLSITFSGTPAAGDKFDLKPMATAARELTLATTRPEDIALASPIRTDTPVTNLGSGKIDGLTITNTDAASSRFSSPSGLDGGPWSMTYTGANTFEIRDNSGALLGTANFTDNNYQNVLAQANLANAGFDFSVSGALQTGDNFTIGYNSGGFNDNRNGLIMADLQTADTTRLSATSKAEGVNAISFNQLYGNMVSLVGERTSQARGAEEANKALLQQTTSWYESLSGVSLDEEASNLIRFQQSYAAAAKILATSQTVFDTLLAAVR